MAEQPRGWLPPVAACGTPLDESGHAYSSDFGVVKGLTGETGAMTGLGLVLETPD